MSQLAESQKRNSQVLAKERSEFRDRLLKIREESVTRAATESSLTLALNQLTINLRKFGAKAPDYFKVITSQMLDIVGEADRILLANESRMRALEF
jgi:hypothetical protein